MARKRSASISHRQPWAKNSDDGTRNFATRGIPAAQFVPSPPRRDVEYLRGNPYENTGPFKK